MVVNEQELFDISKYKLIAEIIKDCVSKGLVKFEYSNMVDDELGFVSKIRALIRVYHPDD